MRVKRLLRIELTVSDLGGAEAFYAGLPGFTAGVRDRASPAMAALFGAARVDQLWLRRGGQTVLLQQFEPPGAPYPANPRSCDQSFQHFALPVPDAAEAAAALHADAISKGGAQHLPQRSGGATAFKFRDPDGHPLEFIAFTNGRAGGIDHSAIVSTNVERSIAFYREELGLRLVSRQTNRGPEQDRLDGLHEAVVEVVALAPEVETPHVELLAYKSPPVRPAPPHHPRDIVATRLVFEVDRLPGRQGAALMRDPDGHLLLLLTRQ